MGEPRYTPADGITDETGRVVVRCVQEIMTLPPADRLNAVTAVARMWTDFRGVREAVVERDPNVTVICGSCAGGDHMCGGDCLCPKCTGVINGMEPTS